MRKIIEAIRAIPWLQTAISIVVFVLGIFIGPLLEMQVSPIINATTVFILITISLGAIIAIWNHTRQQISTLEQYTKVLAKSVGYSVQMLPYAQAYTELKNKVRDAQTEILVFSKYVFDWENGKPIYDRARLESPQRRAVYAEVQAKLRQMRGKGNFRLVRIVQVPKGHHLREIFPYDNVYKQHCEFLGEISRDQPEFASLRTSDVVFENTFAIIDRTFLYMEFDIRNPDTSEVHSPFALIIDNPDSEIVQDLVKLHQRIEATSQLVTDIDPPE